MSGMAMTFRPSDELATKLSSQAEAERISVQALLSKAAQEYLDRNTKKALIRDEVLKVKTNFADALRRLGEGA